MTAADESAGPSGRGWPRSMLDSARSLLPVRGRRALVWAYTPGERGGLALADMHTAQRA